MVEEECLKVKWRLGWKEFRSLRNVVRFSKVSGQMRKMSSMYLVRMVGFIFCWLRKPRRMCDMKMLAMVGEKLAPIDVPLICWKKRWAKEK